MKQIKIKSQQDLEKMKKGGEKLATVRKELEKAVKEGVSAMDIEELANTLIKKEGGEASFKMVPGYSWATCINVNAGLVHGIPKKETIFKKGDLVSVDVGMYLEGFHTDTSTTVLVGEDKGKEKFLKLGQLALKNAIDQARVGNKIMDISKTIQDVVSGAGYSPIRALTGHGVGRELHEEPYIPCFVSGARAKSPDIEPGMVLAIEVMYAQGADEVTLEEDGWTIRTQDGKISALFEETVAVTADGPIILTG